MAPLGYRPKPGKNPLYRGARPRGRYGSGTTGNEIQGQRPSGGGQMTITKAPVGPPVDPQLEAQKAAANLGVKLGDAFDTYQTGRINTAFGNLDDPTADLTSNPYSRAALLQQAYTNQKRGTGNSYAASGQLYAGSLQNAQEANLQGYNQSLDAAKKERDDLLAELLKGKLTRYSQTGADVNTETLQSLLRALGAG